MEPEIKGSIVIEWPQPIAGCLPGSPVAISDALTGKPINTVSRLTVSADPASLVTADLTMLANLDGEPAYDGPGHARDGEIVQGTFRFEVAEMKARAV
jgi:hypothetical protein